MLTMHSRVFQFSFQCRHALCIRGSMRRGDQAPVLGVASMKCLVQSLPLPHDACRCSVRRDSAPASPVPCELHRAHTPRSQRSQTRHDQDPQRNTSISFSRRSVLTSAAPARHLQQQQQQRGSPCSPTATTQACSRPCCLAAGCSQTLRPTRGTAGQRLAAPSSPSCCRVGAAWCEAERAPGAARAQGSS